MPREAPPSPPSLVLVTLRTLRGWTQAQLAQAAGISRKTVQLYETEKAPPRPLLEKLAAVMGYGSETIDYLLLGLTLAAGPPQSPRSPVDLAPGERRALQQVAARNGIVSRDLTERHAEKLARALRARQDRDEARRLWVRLKLYTSDQRWLLVEKAREFQTWALAERLCHESEEAASDKADRALELAGLACRAADLAPGDELWRSRLRGYALAFLANAKRVGNKLLAAEEDFARARALWEEGEAGDPGLLAAWRFLDLEASLRRGQRRFSEALALLERARTAAPQKAHGRILLKKAATLQQQGETEKAVEALQAAAPLVDGQTAPRLRNVLQFNLASCLCDLERYSEAEALVAEVRELAVALRNELDMLRAVWLSGKVAAGLGQTGAARATFEQVRRELEDRDLDYDRALVTLDLAALLLRQGCTAEVRSLADEMVWSFARQNVHREALAALKMFREAVRKDEATAELAGRLIAYLNRARNDPRLRFEP